MLACALWGRISDPVFFGVFRCAVPKYKFASMHRFQRWRDLFQGASTVQGVERLIRDYVDSIPPTVLAALPDECRRALGDPNVQRAAVTILHCELAFKGEPATAEQLHEVAHTFAAASLRITRLTKEPMIGD